MFTFTPLLGAQSTSRSSQSILELDGGVKILIDVGWDEKFGTQQLTELEKHVPTLSFILLTHATISHIGAFAHCCKHIPLFAQVPVYATSPVIAFGRTLLQDLYTSTPLAATCIPSSTSAEYAGSNDETSQTDILREAPSFEEITNFFALITSLKYSQPHQPKASYFSAPLEGLTLTAYNAGHTLGGTIWHIQHGMESVIYAIDWHQARENVIAGAAWFGGVGGSEVIEQLRKPTALVCSSRNGDKIAMSGGKIARDDLLVDHIRSSIAKGGAVLIPTDSSARILELAWLLERTWTQGKDDAILQKAKVYLASRSGHSTLRHARSLLEWMDDSIVRASEGDDENAMKSHKRSGSKQVNGHIKPSRPFEFKHIKVIERQTQLDKLLQSDEPRVIIASDSSLEWGLSRDLFEHVVQKPENLLVLTERFETNHPTGTDSIRSRLWQWYQDRGDGIAVETGSNNSRIEQVHSGGRQIDVQNVQTAPLDSAELQQYQQYVATWQQKRNSRMTGVDQQFSAAREAIMDDDDESSSESDESDDEQQGRALNVSATLGHANRNRVALSDEELGVSILVRKKGVYDFDVRSKRGRNAVFPHTHTRRRGDEFGEFIKPEDFLREEEKTQNDALANKQGGQLGQKRKWDEINQASLTKVNKRQPSRNNDEADATMDDDDNDSDNSDASEVDTEFNQEAPAGPRKVIFDEKNVVVNARLAFVDFAGLHDQRSLQMLIPLIDPKKLILVHGSAEETKALAADCKELLSMKVAGEENQSAAEIFTPVIGQTVDASVDTNAWIVKLSRELARRLQWQNVKNIGVVTITGQLKAESVGDGDDSSVEPSNFKKLKLEAETDQKAEKTTEKLLYKPVLEPIPVSLAASTRSSSQPIHVGDLRLADLRRLMNATGHSAEFRGEGTLLVDSMIAVRKLASGKIVVEGAPVNSVMSTNIRSSDSFTSVKRKIYEGLAVVAAT